MDDTVYVTMYVKTNHVGNFLLRFWTDIGKVLPDGPSLQM